VSLLHQAFSPTSERLTRLHSGSVFWHLESERYFGPRVHQVKDTLTVGLRALEPGAKPAFDLMYTLPHILRATSTPALSCASSSAISSANILSSPRSHTNCLPLGEQQRSRALVSKATVSEQFAFAQAVTRRSDVTNILVFTSILLASSPMSLIHSFIRTYSARLGFRPKDLPAPALSPINPPPSDLYLLLHLRCHSWIAGPTLLFMMNTNPVSRVQTNNRLQAI